MRLGAAEKAVLAALVQGSRLRSHRYLDGVKVYRLHRPEDDAETYAERILAGKR